MTTAEIAELERVLRLIPGYDPWAQAEGCWLDHEAAARAIRFFPACLRHVEGDLAGKPFVLEPWQQAVVGNLFGWQRRDSLGRVVRRYREVMLYVPRKSGKTPLAAGICLYVLFCDGEAGAQIYGAATTRDQAALLYKQARGMVKQCKALSDRAIVYKGENTRSIILKADPGSVYKVISSDAAGQHGGTSHLVLIDELHAQESRDLVDVMETSMSSQNRKQPLLILITTADFDRPSICNEKHTHACAVRDNGGDRAKPGYDPAFLPVVYEMASGDDPFSPETWRKANPNLGVSVSLDYLERQALKAKEDPAFLNTFVRLHLNGKTNQDTCVIPLDAWDACAADIDVEALKGRRCFLGLDCSSCEDLTALAAVFPDDGGGCDVLSWAWCPEDKIEDRANAKVPYQLWHRQGWIAATAGNQIDYAVILETLVDVVGTYEVAELAYDPHGAEHLIQELVQRTNVNAVRMVQTVAHMSPPSKDLIRRVKAKALRHRHDPLLRWCAGNVAAHFQGRIPAGGVVGEFLDKVPILFSKRSSRDKIDPIVAIVLALSCFERHPTNEGSVYEQRGILVL